jgi:hypothetical protein
VRGRNGRDMKQMCCGAFYRPGEVGFRERGTEWASFKTSVSAAGALLENRSIATVKYGCNRTIFDAIHSNSNNVTLVKSGCK